MNAPANLPATTTSKTLTSEQSLPDKLLALVMGSDSPVVGPNTAAKLRVFAAEPEPPLATRDEIEVLITKLTMATAKTKVSEKEAGERLDLYALALKDVPVDDLRWAFVELLKTATFLPTPAEVRAKALVPGARRKYAKSRARHLSWKHDTEWRETGELLPPEEVKALLARVGIGDGP